MIRDRSTDTEHLPENQAWGLRRAVCLGVFFEMYGRSVAEVMVSLVFSWTRWQGSAG